MGTTFQDLSIRQKVISLILTVITALFGAWWYESDQETWSWIGFVFTFVFITFGIYLFMFIESRIKNKFISKS